MMAQKEAVAMRIITVVTLIYLPATFVSVCPNHGVMVPVRAQLTSADFL